MKLAAQKLRQKKEHSGLALMIERLISMGHLTALEYTPRQVTAFSLLANERLKLDMANKLALHALAAKGDGKTIQKQIKNLEK
jgi:hypothetical protein